MKKHPIFVAISSPFNHGILDIVKRSQILFEFDALVTQVDTLLVSWQNFVQASLFACLSLFVLC